MAMMDGCLGEGLQIESDRQIDVRALRWCVPASWQIRQEKREERNRSIDANQSRMWRIIQRVLSLRGCIKVSFVQVVVIASDTR